MLSFFFFVYTVFHIFLGKFYFVVSDAFEHW